MKICVTGYQGRLGSVLTRLYGCHPLECDITDSDAVRSEISKKSPDVIINCAALTQVDEAETDYKKFYFINGASVLNFRDYALSGGMFVHISTDYVFNGSSGPYDENAIPVREYFPGRVTEPVNAYGWSKYAAEIFCNDAKNMHIVRTTGLFGSSLPDFAGYFLDQLESGNQFDAIKTLRGNHTYIPFLAEALVQLVSPLAEFPKILHIASIDITSRYEFAVKLANIFGYSESLVNPVKYIPSWIAKRPTKGGLITDKAVRLGLPLYTIEQGIRAYKDSIK